MKTLIKLQRMAFMSFILLAIVSCEKDEEIVSSQILNETAVSSDSKGMMVLGKQLENPYSVENMQKAYNELVSSDNLKSAEDFKVEATHLYIRFRPQNVEELDRLKADTNIVLYDFPLDYEIEVEGEYYHDPEIPADKPTYQYAAVKVDQVLPEDMDYDVLSELFIYKDEGSQLKRENTFAWDRLEDKALEITGNIEKDRYEEFQLKASKKKWRPAGRIQVWSCDLEKFVPIEGVIVKARRWFTTYTGTTDKDGYYSCSGVFKKKAKYSISWERYDFQIRSSFAVGAKYIGPEQVGDWNLNISGGFQEYYAHVFRGAHHYYYKDIQGLRRPPMNNMWKRQLKIRACKKNKGSLNGTYNIFTKLTGVGNHIQIYYCGESFPSVYYYAIIIHELAHASHYAMNGFKAIQSPMVAETWAMGVEWALTRMVYPDYCNSFRYSRKLFTGLVEDLIDCFSHDISDYYSFFPLMSKIELSREYDEYVSGYTLRQLEDALKEQLTWDDWKDSIKEKYNNPTEKHLDDLFDFWSTK